LWNPRDFAEEGVAAEMTTRKAGFAGSKGTSAKEGNGTIRLFAGIHQGRNCSHVLAEDRYSIRQKLPFPQA
jgi:hypothetical protein